MQVVKGPSPSSTLPALSARERGEGSRFSQRASLAFFLFVPRFSRFSNNLGQYSLTNSLQYYTFPCTSNRCPFTRPSSSQLSPSPFNPGADSQPHHQ